MLIANVTGLGSLQSIRSLMVSLSNHALRPHKSRNYFSARVEPTKDESISIALVTPNQPWLTPQAKNSPILMPLEDWAFRMNYSGAVKWRKRCQLKMPDMRSKRQFIVVISRAWELLYLRQSMLWRKELSD